MSELKVGDTVRLRSGGPLMTIEGFETGGGEQKAQCVWIERNAEKRSNYIPAVLAFDDGSTRIA
jgi:uncharacterized protein YodC (DUF2158 family)